MNIWLISIFEQTPIDNVFSTRFLSIAEAALKRKHNVTFFASTFKHNTKSQRFESTTSVTVKENYEMVYVNSKEYKKNISLKRAFSHYHFARSLLVEVKKRKKPDLIYLAFPPISVANEISKWAKIQKIPFVIDVIDPWPDIFKKMLKNIPAKISDIIFLPMTLKVKSFFKRTDAVTAIGNQYLKWAIDYNQKLKTHICYPAAQISEIQDVLYEIGKSTFKDNSKFQVIYAGSLASAYDIPTILKAAEILNKKYKDKIQFVIAGAGPQEELVKVYLQRLKNLRYTGRLNKKELLKEYYLSDLGLIQHHKGATQTVTYKLFDLLASNLPIMNSLESELNNIVLENKVGLFNEPGDFNTLAKNIEYCFNNKSELSAMKKRTIEVANKLGNASIVYDRTIEFLEKISLEESHVK